MKYVPQEGADYIVDLYQIADVPQDADAEVIRSALNARAFEYHPDRLEGLAPEFQDRGERMAILLNRARTILLDDKRRQEYDGILEAWDGPISSDGTPVMRIDDMLRAEMAASTTDEIEAVFDAQREQAASMVKHDPTQQALFARMLDTVEGEDAEGVRRAYDSALFAEDQVLAIEEYERGRLIGLTGNGRYETTIGYAEKVKLAIESVREEQIDDRRRRALGGVSARLALLAGEADAASEPAEILTAESVILPHYFESQAERIAKLATKREEILARRLEIFQPTYPLAEVQTQAHPDFAIGISSGTEDAQTAWIGFRFDRDTTSLTNVNLPDEISGLLSNGKFEQVYANGFNVLTFELLEHIEPATLLEEAYNKHLRKFFPDCFAED